MTRRPAFWLIGVLVLALCGGGGAWALKTSPGRTPEDAVEKYFAALADRDAAAALALVEDRPREMTLLGDETLKHPDYTPPSDPYLERVSVYPVTAKSPTVVRASYLVGRLRQQLDLSLVRSGLGWRIYLGWADIVANTRRVLPLVVAGTLVPKSDRGMVPAFPGSYVVRLAEQPLFEAPPVTVYAGAGTGNRLELRLRGPHQDELERQVREYLDACAATAEFPRPGCPFRRASGAENPPISSRKVVRYPALLMWAETDGTVHVMGQTPGRAEVTRTTAGSKPLVTAEWFQVNGRLVIRDDGRFTFTHT